MRKRFLCGCFCAASDTEAIGNRFALGFRAAQQLKCCLILQGNYTIKLLKTLCFFHYSLVIAIFPTL